MLEAAPVNGASSHWYIHTTAKLSGKLKKRTLHTNLIIPRAVSMTPE